MSATLPVPAGPFVPLSRLPMSSVRRPATIDLDGTWDFQLLSSPQAEPGQEWESIEVPGLWTMTSDVDRPHYTNVPMPFDHVPPAVPDHNPTGVYRRTVTLDPKPETVLVLHVGAAESAVHAVVNGVLVGSSTDSHLAAEFDITGAVRAGENEIVLVVPKWNAESYLEDQDQWWHGGIARSVMLVELPAVRIADVTVVADYEAETSLGSLSVSVMTEGLAHLHEVDWTVEARILGETTAVPVTARRATQTLPRGVDDRSERPEPRFPADMMDVVSLKAAGAPIPAELEPVARNLGQTVFHETEAGEARFERTGLDVPAWSAEAPHLESLELRLLDATGAVRDEVTYRVGFRRVEIVGRDLLVNGRRVYIQGANRHDLDPRTGRVMTREGILAELSMMKRSHINAVRTSHYPNDPVLLDLADELGLYVLDEADVEGHAFAGVLPDDARYLSRFLERYSRMVIRDRNHPSVIMWSLGNETGYGAAHDAMASWSRATDPTRPVHYEGAVSMDWHAGHAATDVVCPMYPAFSALEAYAHDPRADRPLIMCEYAYSQGNSTGGFAHYWDLIESLPGVQGGFIWEWRDHALDPDGSGRFRYGGDFGDTPNDGPVLNNGIVLPDLQPKPALAEVRGVFNPVRIVSGSAEVLAGRVLLRNRQSFRALDDFAYELRVETADGPVGVHLGVLPPIGPGETGQLVLPAEVREAAATPGALALTLQLRTRSAAAWAPEGTDLAACQVLLPHTPAALPVGVRSPALSAEGRLVHPLLAAEPELCLWRALTENEQAFSMDRRFVASGFFSLTLDEVDVRERETATVVVRRYLTAWGEKVVHERRIEQVGTDDYVLHERVDLPPGQQDGLRVGMELTLVEGFATAEFVGLGPHENYPDRQFGASLARWSVPVDAMETPYVVPQETGSRGGTWATRLSGPAGVVRTEHAVPLAFAAQRHTIEDLEHADHWWKLPDRATTTVHLDVVQRGVGSARLGPDTLPEFRPSHDSYAWSWRLTLTAA